MSRPEGMSSRHWDTIRNLPDRPTSAFPFGLRGAVLERAAILIYQAGLSPDEADARAIAETIPGWTPSLFSNWEEE